MTIAFATFSALGELLISALEHCGCVRYRPAELAVSPSASLRLPTPALTGPPGGRLSASGLFRSAAAVDRDRQIRLTGAAKLWPSVGCVVAGPANHSAAPRPRQQSSVSQQDPVAPTPHHHQQRQRRPADGAASRCPSQPTDEPAEGRSLPALHRMQIAPMHRGSRTAVVGQAFQKPVARRPSPRRLSPSPWSPHSPPLTRHRRPRACPCPSPRPDSTMCGMDASEWVRGGAVLAAGDAATPFTHPPTHSLTRPLAHSPTRSLTHPLFAQSAAGRA